jgi:hypothetical protein
MTDTISASLKRQLEQLVGERDRLVQQYAYVFSSYAFIEKAIFDIRAAAESLDKKDVEIEVRDGAELGQRDRWMIRSGNRRLSTQAPTFRSKAEAVIEATKQIQRASEVENPKKEEVAAMVAAYLTAADAPISRAELFERLRQDGIVIQGKDPEMVLSTMLWRAGPPLGIYNVKGVGYWLDQRRGEIENAFQ